jgi:Thioredoxin
MDFKQLWQQAMPFDDYVRESAPEHRPLWDGVYRLARVPHWALAPVAGGDARHLLVLAEDWCGDAVNTVPVLARWAQRAPGVSLRILRRDEHPDVMDRYLTNGARSIPVVIALDREFGELGAWGPRPRELQAWVMAHKDMMPKDERYREVRRWYARDKGETTIREVMEAMGAAVNVAG